MANTSVVLGDYWDGFVAEMRAGGRYGTASEVVRAGLRLLEARERELDKLRRHPSSVDARAARRAERKAKIEAIAAESGGAEYLDRAGLVTTRDQVRWALYDAHHRPLTPEEAGDATTDEDVAAIRIKLGLGPVLRKADGPGHWLIRSDLYPASLLHPKIPLGQL